MRVLAVSASSALLLASAVSAFRDSSPLLIWSSTPNAALSEAQDVLTSGVIGADAIYGTLESVGCDWDTAVVISQDELHNNHLDQVSIASEFGKADLHVPYLIKPTAEALEAAVKSWAASCGVDVVDEEHTQGAEDKRSVMYYYRSEQGGNPALPRGLSSRNIVVLTGTRDLDLAKNRASAEKPFEEPVEEQSEELEVEQPDLASEVETIKDDDVKGNKTGHNGTALLDRYELFSTPVILSVLISFGIILPVLLLGISSLAGVQVPPRMLEISKTLSVKQDRKDQ